MKLVRSTVLLTLLAFTAGGCSSKKTPSADTSAAAVQAPAAAEAAEPTANDISNYKLDMDKMRKYSLAIKGFGAIARTDSTAAEAMSANAGESTQQMIAKLETNPAAMKVLGDAGLTAREYVWITAAWMQAAMTQAMLESNKSAKLPPGQNIQNLEFLKTHKAELEPMMKGEGKY